MLHPGLRTAQLFYKFTDPSKHFQIQNTHTHLCNPNTHTHTHTPLPFPNSHLDFYSLLIDNSKLGGMGRDAGGDKVQAGLGVDLRVSSHVSHVLRVFPAHALHRHPLLLPLRHHLLHILGQDHLVSPGVQEQLGTLCGVLAEGLVQLEAPP